MFLYFLFFVKSVMFNFQMGSPQQKPKLMKILCDVSGSMYRFNGQDGRLDRELETMLMVMEAFESYEHKIKVCTKIVYR